MNATASRVDSKTIVICMLAATSGLLGGWILNQELHQDSTPSAAAAAPFGSRAAEAPSRASTTDTAEPQILALVLPTTTPVNAGGAPPRRVAAVSPVVTGSGNRPVTESRNRADAAAVTLNATSIETWYQLLADSGSIVSVEQNGSLTANTGAAGDGGIVALESSDSSLDSGTSSTSGPVVDTPSSSPAPTGASQGSMAANVSINGFENHALHVTGDNQVVTYDDSNVFINHNGNVNANTGDTDTSGLNAVDVTDSTIVSGNSSDDDSPDHSHGDASAASTGSPPPRAGSAAGGGLTIGGDGYDDVSVTSTGNGDVVTEDDSNVILGGIGDVNAQIGDSDTGGTVAMAIRGSTLVAGCSGAPCTAPPVGR